ncbi:MAG TPA: glyoxalase superfamily protein [Mesorhizobium sp.]|uniref:glyoxalase superfamily protein n=1 Tax=Mesorhizobium sp. TaxID=1871066 RepID=UPI002DDD56A8|nr:glyoxalase superfamily protein [Mesorhizobium sp.]HEV2502759.1 glyoxalase superfamily protein [Mesorhizobium sp.]
MRTFRDAKVMAKTLRQGLRERRIDLSHSDCLELVARQFGLADWNTLAAKIELQPDKSMLPCRKAGWSAAPAAATMKWASTRVREQHSSAAGMDWTTAPTHGTASAR